MDWLHKAFSGGMDPSRVNPAGIVLMLCSIAGVLLAGRIARSASEPERAANAIKIISLVICAGGALLAILG